jgi:hypothetical protein
VWQSIELEREPFESEERMELRRREEETTNMARLQRKGSTNQESGNKERVESLEARVLNTEGELWLLKQELRNVVMDLVELKEARNHSNMRKPTSAEKSGGQDRRLGDALMEFSSPICGLPESATDPSEHGRQLRTKVGIQHNV